MACSTLVAVLALAGAVASGASSQAFRTNFPPPSSYETIWAFAARGAYDPSGNSTLLGACRRLLGAPGKVILNRRECKPDAAHSWVPTKLEPRYVDIRFEARPTIVASRVSGVQLLVLNRGTLDPAISSIEMMVASAANSSRATPVLLYRGRQGDVLNCPGMNTYGMNLALLRPAGAPPLVDATVLGLRINVTGGVVPKKGDLPSISAVGLLVTRTE